jgi:hypothetical protein
VTDGPDDRLTETRQLVAILTLSVRPNGKVNGALRHEHRSYRFSGLSTLSTVVDRWLAEVLGAPVAVDEPARTAPGDRPAAERFDEE